MKSSIPLEWRLFSLEIFMFVLTAFLSILEMDYVENNYGNIIFILYVASFHRVLVTFHGLLMIIFLPQLSWPYLDITVKEMIFHAVAGFLNVMNFLFVLSKYRNYLLTISLSCVTFTNLGLEVWNINQKILNVGYVVAVEHLAGVVDDWNLWGSFLISINSNEMVILCVPKVNIVLEIPKAVIDQIFINTFWLPMAKIHRTDDMPRWVLARKSRNAALPG